MIERLIADDIATIWQAMQENDVEYLHYILLKGKGYENMTLRELIDEYNSRTWEDE
jgi:hypothetical protein